MNPYNLNRVVPQIAAFLVVLACLVLGLLLLPGCVAYRAPVISWQSGPENAYNQERSGVTSRSTNAEQQVADKTESQTQTENVATAEMSTAMETTRQVGLKQGQAQTRSVAQGRDDVNAPSSSTGQASVGQQGSDQLGYNPGGGASAPGAVPAAPGAATAVASLSPDVQALFGKYWQASGQTTAVPAQITGDQWRAFTTWLTVPGAATPATP